MSRQKDNGPDWVSLAAGLSDAEKARVKRATAIIKASMPETWDEIATVCRDVGDVARAAVRCGLAGRPGAFWAGEAGYVVGTQFQEFGVQVELAKQMVTFGATHWVVWAQGVAQSYSANKG